MLPSDAIIAFAITSYLVAVALLAGSFVNLAADRMPRGESLIHPRSHCRSCGRVLNLVDLIPVAGYVVRSGRCASCGASIGVSSPLIEGMCGAVMLASLMLLGPVRGAMAGLAALSLAGGVIVALSAARARATRRGSRRG
jgi:leader peptidase (prepilin peptidase) / N-methyltransferase